MDGDADRAAQYETPYQETTTHTRLHSTASSSQNYSGYQSEDQSAASTSINRYQGTRQLGTPYGTYGFGQTHFSNDALQGEDQAQDVAMQYQQFAGVDGRQTPAHRGAFQRDFNVYRPGSMLPPMHPHASYGSLEHYEHRNPSSSETISASFTSQAYLNPADVAAGPHNSQLSVSESHDSQYPAGTISLAEIQPLAFADTSSAHNIFRRPQFGDHEEMPKQDEHNKEDDTSQSHLDNEKANYDEQIKTVFELIISGKLVEAKDRILSATSWLTSSIVALGLHHDQADMYTERQIMWRELNHCWEALGLKQRDLIHQAQIGQSQGHILTTEAIIDLVNELVKMCDQIEHHGLVDYEMGIWEEQIVAIFISCLDLLTSDVSNPLP